MAKRSKQPDGGTATLDIDDAFRGPPVEYSTEATKPIPSAFDDAVVPPSEPAQQFEPVTSREPAKTTPYGEDDANFAKLKAEVENLGRERKVPERGPDGKFLKREAEPTAGGEPASTASPATPAAEPSPPAAQPTKQPAESEFTAELLDEAQALFASTGLAQEDFPTPAALEKAVRKMDARVLAHAGRQAKNQPAAEAVAPPPQPAAPPAQPKPAEPAPASDDVEAELKRLESFDPDWGGGFRRLLAAKDKANDARIARLEQQLGAVAEQRNQRAALEAVNRFDDALERHPQFEAFLGKGRFAEVRTNPQIVGARRAVDAAMAAIAKSHNDLGLPIPSDSALFRKAVAAAYPDEFAKSAVAAHEASRKKAAAQRQTQFTSPATHQSPGPEKGPDQKSVKDQKADATRAVELKLREFGAV
jgi:hypothetical protein